MNKKEWVDQLLGTMTLEQKVGQLMVFGFMGPVVYPHIKELIQKYHVGGFRIAQKFHPGSAESRVPGAVNYALYHTNTMDVPVDLQNKRINCTSREYASALNSLRDLALDRKDGIGLHFAYDQEGEGSDFLFQQRLFPYPMGLVNSGDEQLAYEVGLAAGMQARALGANMIHSPCLDINTNPENPEIGPRSYSEDPDIATRFALQSMRGYREAGIFCVGKHFPGRGASSEDAHFQLPSIDLSLREMREMHLKPFQMLIDHGIPAIMAAFTAYPGIDGMNIPAATNPNIVTELLRKEMKFNGIITTDNVQMKGLLNKYELGEAVVRCLIAGCDLVLFRSESPATIYVIECVLEAVRSKRYSEAQLNQSVERILSMRYDMGLHINGGKVEIAQSDMFYNQFVVDTARKAAEKCTVIVKNEENILPIARGKKVLLIEQIHHFHSFINTMYTHAGVLWEEMRRHSDDVSVILIHEKFTKEDREAVLARLLVEHYDIIVITSYYNYRSHATMVDFLKEIAEINTPMVVVSNNPYESFGVPSFVKNAVVNYCMSGRENVEAVANTLFGTNNNEGDDLIV